MRAARGVCQTADMRMAKAVTASGHHQYVNYPTGSSVLFYCSSARITARGSGTGSYPDMSNRPCFVALVKLCSPLRWQRVLLEHVVHQPGHADITLRGGAVAGGPSCYTSGSSNIIPPEPHHVDAQHPCGCGFGRIAMFRHGDDSGGSHLGRGQRRFTRLGYFHLVVRKVNLPSRGVFVYNPASHAWFHAQKL